MLVEFLDWWGGQLRSMVPARFAGGQGAQDALVADVSVPGAFSVLRRRRGVEQRVAQGSGEAAGERAGLGLRAALANRPGSEPVLLRIPPAWVLERRVGLPLAAERDLARVLGYEMERLTPFSAAELVWTYAVQQRDRTRARIDLRLTMVPRSLLAPVLQELRDEGAAPSAIEAALPDGVRVLKLAGEAGARPGLSLHNLSVRSLAIACAALAALALISPLLRQSLALAGLHEQLGELQPGMTQVETLRRRIAGSSAGGDAVAAETRRLGDTLEALAAITEVLPDDSYLTEFTMRERKMTLAGLAGSAPKLISGLSADPRVRNPAFTAPVTKSETNHQDVFAIRAELAP